MIIVAVAAGAIALVVVLVILGAALTAQPNIALTNFGISVTGSPPNCTANYSFHLVNSGQTGLANIEFKADGVLIGVNNYLVQARSTLPVAFSVSAPDCAQHFYTAEIKGQRAA